MNDILRLNKTNLVDINDEYFNINLSLSIPEFNKLAQQDKNKAVIELTYVVLSSSYKSDLVMKGLSGKELHDAICNRLSIPFDYVISDDVKAAIEYYKQHYNYGVYGTIAELFKSFEITRNSISLINSILYSSQLLLKDKLNEQLTKEETIAIVSGAKDIINNINSIQSIASNLDKSINDLKLISDKVTQKEQNTIRAFGGGSVPVSARRK